VIAEDICCQKKQTEPILVEGEWSYDDFKTDTFTVMYDREGANGLRQTWGFFHSIYVIFVDYLLLFADQEKKTSVFHFRFSFVAKKGKLPFFVSSVFPYI
jgi:hypothetical protein